MGIKDYDGIRYSHSHPSKEFKEYRSYGRYWEKTYFNNKTGGYVVTHEDRIKSAAKSKNAKKVFMKEQDMAHDLAEIGHKIAHKSDESLTKGRSYDVIMDGQPAELKSSKSHNHIEEYIRHAVKEQGAKLVVVRIENGAKIGKFMSELNKCKRLNCRIIYYKESEKILRDL